ncbi:MAG: hypothetical protein JNL07_07780 [Rhodospirillales bacterium]|nr:hypothetical protein [Rhodospirillales bacterium]
MPASHDVTLPRSVRPVFPDRCPCGGEAGPGKAIKLSFVGYSRAPSLVDMALLGPMAGGNTLDHIVVPASEDCARRLRRYHFWVKLLKYGLWAPLVALALWLGAGVVVASIMLIVALVAPVVWEITHPPAVGATPKPETITYEFASRDYAEAFARLNGAALDGAPKAAAPPA